jgi:predicted dehydrogenase
MRVLLGDEWEDGFLDEHRPPRAYRVQVLAWRNLERLDDLYFVRRGSWRILANYLRELGPVEVARKVASRRSERHRNRKFVSVGLGRVLEGPDGEGVEAGRVVAFLAPCHPACMERVVLPAALVREAEPERVAETEPGRILYLPEGAGARAGMPRWWEAARGWHPESAREIGEAEALMEAAAAELRALDWRAARPLPCTDAAPVSETRGEEGGGGGAKRAVLFGYGNYAKTVVIPNVRPYLRVERIHEIDPTQIPRESGAGVAWDTAPGPREGRSVDAFLIAGYHHTHAPLAVEALRRGSYAVVEKPVVTTAEQLEALLAAVREAPRLFACFHKRYLPLNELALADLGVRRGEAVSYHCIVYEVPLPELHWYRWPASRSRLVSNGCHWIDHFLYLNDYAPVRATHLAGAADGTLNCSVELENGAFFTMALTDRGSERIGVQDQVELRARGVTVRMTNGSGYVAEGADRILRRRGINKIRSYQAMYRSIGQRIAAGEPGDSVRSLEVSSRLMLELESRLEELRMEDRPASLVGGAPDTLALARNP